MKFYYARTLMISSCLLMVTNPIMASTRYSPTQCQQIATAISNGQRPPLTNEELAELDSDTVHQLTSALAQIHREREAQIEKEKSPDQMKTDAAKVINNQALNDGQSQGLKSDDQTNNQSSSSNELPVPKEALTVHQQQFIDSIAKDACQIAEQNDLYTSVLIAQAVIESDWGRSDLARIHKNLFGIKGEFRGMSANLPTTENEGGHEYQTTSQFRHYSTIRESLQDYAQVLNQSLYAAAHKSKCRQYQEATAEISKKYATDPQYQQKLNHLIQKYDLTKYDYGHKQSQSKKPKNQSILPEKQPMSAESSSTKQHHRQKGMIIPLIGGIGSMSLVELIKRLLK